MPRINRYLEVATDADGNALWCWLTDEVAIGQQPVDPSRPDGDWQMATRPRGVTGRGTPIATGGCNAVAAGGGAWMRRLDNTTPLLSGSQAWQPSDGRVGDIDRDGTAATTSDDGLTVYLGAASYVRAGVQGTSRLRDGLLSWTSGGVVHVLDTATLTELAVVQVGSDAAKAVAFRAPDGRPWVLYQTDATGGVIHPYDDASHGYRYGPDRIGPGTEGIYDPDTLIGNDGALHVAWAAREGQWPSDIRWATVARLGDGMVPLQATVPPFVPPVEPPPVEPPQGPTEPPGGHAMQDKIKDVMGTVIRFAGAFPVPRGDGSEQWINDALRFGWTLRLAQQVRYEHGPEWGSKSTSDGSPQTKEALAWNGPDGMHVWDMLKGAATGNPVLSTDPDHHYVPDQWFIPVDPVNHLADVVDTTHPPLPSTLWGITAFDLFEAFAVGDFDYYEQVVKPSGLVPRIVVASIWNGGVTERRGRDMAEGRKHLYDGLQRLAADGIRCEVTLLVDTAEYAKRDGLTREGALEHVELCNAAMCVWPDAVAAVTIGNENSHGVEMPWMTDRDFLRECRARIDARFPVADGAGHGGEPVRVGGSYARHHANRGLPPEENGRIMADAQAAYGVQVVDGEPLGTAEPGRVAGRERTSDPDYARRIAQACVDFGLGGATAHLDSGIGCRVGLHGDTEREALRRFVEVARTARPVPGVGGLDGVRAAARRAATEGVTGIYRELLGREPDAAGLAYYVEAVYDGRLTFDGVRDDVRGSDEYKARHGGA